MLLLLCPNYFSGRHCLKVFILSNRSPRSSSKQLFHLWRNLCSRINICVTRYVSEEDQGYLSKLSRANQGYVSQQEGLSENFKDGDCFSNSDQWDDCIKLVPICMSFSFHFVTWLCLMYFEYFKHFFPKLKNSADFIISSFPYLPFLLWAAARGWRN